MSEPTHYEDGLNPVQPKGGSDQPQSLSRAQWASYWSDQLAIAIRDHQTYLNECDEIVEIYRHAKHNQKSQQRRRMNVLYANTETLRGAVFARLGKPDVRPRWSATGNEMARQAAEMIERALVHATDDADYQRAVKRAVLQAILCARGIVWVEYEPTIATVPTPEGDEQQIVEQRCRKMFLNRHDFLHSPAETWDENWWVARRHRMTLEDLKANRFPDADKIPRNWSPKKDATHQIEDDAVRRAEVWEIWSKVHRKRFYCVRGYSAILRVDDDPYGLKDFWPMPKPLTLTSEIDSLIPVLEWDQYKALANDLESIMNRIAGLTSAMRRRGVRDADITELKKLATAQDNELVPVKNYEKLVQKGGLGKAYELEDITGYVQALTELYRAKVETEASIDKLTGIADVMRGNVQPDEKLGQTELKAQFGGLRIKERQEEVRFFVRDLMRIEAEIIVEHYEPDVLSRMTEIEVTYEMLEALRDDQMRSYLVDVETDTTVFEDAESHKASVAEAVQATTSLMQAAIPILQSEPEMGEVVFEMMALTLRTIKGGRTIEEAIDRARQQRQQRLEQAAMQPPQEAQPDPRLVVEERRAEADMAQADAKMRQTEMDMQRKEREHGMRMSEMEAKAMFQAPQVLQ